MTNRSCDLKSKITAKNEVVAILSYLYLTIVLLNYLHYHPIVEIIPYLITNSIPWPYDGRERVVVSEGATGQPFVLECRVRRVFNYYSFQTYTTDLFPGWFSYGVVVKYMHKSVTHQSTAPWSAELPLLRHDNLGVPASAPVTITGEQCLKRYISLPCE